MFIICSHANNIVHYKSNQFSIKWNMNEEYSKFEEKWYMIQPAKITIKMNHDCLVKLLSRKTNAKLRYKKYRRNRKQQLINDCAIVHNALNIKY